VWSELRERVAQYDSRTSDMRLGGGGVSPSVEARRRGLVARTMEEANAST
jgi:hypothetical protein